MINPMTLMYSQDEGKIQSSKKSNVVTPRPSSPREFFARIYGHLESEKSKSEPTCENVSHLHDNVLSDSSSDVDINDSNLRVHPNAFEPTHDKNLSRFSFPNATTSSGESCQIDKSPATTALVQLASVNRFPNVIPGLPGLPGFLPPRSPFLFSGDLPFPTGFSAFLSRRRRGPGRSRRQRTTFSAAQTLRLEVEFRRAEYVGRPRRLELAAALRLSETQVKIWFQNRRAKDKRIEKAHLDHHYRTLAGFPPEYYANFPPGNCGICIYKRETPCGHFSQITKSRDSTTPESLTN